MFSTKLKQFSLTAISLFVALTLFLTIPVFSEIQKFALPAPITKAEEGVNQENINDNNNNVEPKQDKKNPNEFEDIEINREYKLFSNKDVSVNFTKLDPNTQAPSLSIKEATVSIENQEVAGYEFVTNMQNGAFKYDLTLPNKYNDLDVTVQYTENKKDYKTVVEKTISPTSVTIENLDHFTVFVVLPVDPSNNQPELPSPGTTTVDNTSPGNWYYYVMDDGLAEFVSTPANNLDTEGNQGSFMLKSQSIGSKAIIGGTDYNNNLVSDIADMSYQVYVENRTVEGLYPYVNIYIDLDDDGIYDERLTNEPTTNSTVPLDIWQEIDLTNEMWTRSSNGGTESLADIQTDIPNGKILGIAINGGDSSSTNWADFTGYVDNFTVNGQTFDFELEETFENLHIKSYECPMSVATMLENSATKNDFKPDNSGAVTADLATLDCTLEDGYSLGHASEGVVGVANIPATGISIGITENGGLLDVELPFGTYMFGALDSTDDSWLEDEEIYGLACNNSNPAGFRDNNAEVAELANTQDVYCNLYVEKTVDAPVLLGSNAQGQSATYDEGNPSPNTTPNNLDVACGAPTDPYIAQTGEKYASNWTEVEGTNIKYIRHNVRPDGSHLLLGQNGRVTTNDPNDLNEIATVTDSYTNNHSNGWGSFGGTEGVYSTQVRAFDDQNSNGKYDLGEPISEWSNTCYSEYDNTAPVVTVDEKKTGDATPEITGTITEKNIDTIQITVEGNTYTATNNGDGTWTLPNDTISPELTDGVYDVSVTVSDLAGNTGTDKTTNELTIDLPPVVTVNNLETNDNTPKLAGTIDDPNATVEISVEGNTYTATNNGDGTWALEVTNTLTNGTHEVVATATDVFGNTAEDKTSDELFIDAQAPTVNQLEDKIIDEGGTIPVITITGSDNHDIKELCITVKDEDGNDFVAKTCDSSGNGTSYDWTNPTSMPSIADTSLINEGEYTISYYVVDSLGNASDTKIATYTINNVPPQITLTSSNQTINEGEEMTFTGSFTDPSTEDAGDEIFDDEKWTYNINYGDGQPESQIDFGEIDEPGELVIPNYIYNYNGEYIFTLEVCESITNSISEKECSTKTIDITVNNVEPSINITANPGTSILQDDDFTLTAEGTGGNEPLTYNWSGDCTGTNPEFTQTNANGTYNCTVTVTDFDGDTAVADIQVTTFNNIPTVVILANPGTNVEEETSVALTGRILGGDADFTYTWGGACSGSGTNSGDYTDTASVPSTPGSYYCRIDVTDTNGDTAAAGVTVAVNETIEQNTIDNIEEEEETPEEEPAEEGEVAGTSETVEEEPEGEVLGANEDICEKQENEFPWWLVGSLIFGFFVLTAASMIRTNKQNSNPEEEWYQQNQ